MTVYAHLLVGCGILACPVWFASLGVWTLARRRRERRYLAMRPYLMCYCGERFYSGASVCDMARHVRHGV